MYKILYGFLAGQPPFFGKTTQMNFDSKASDIEDIVRSTLEIVLLALPERHHGRYLCPSDRFRFLEYR